MASSSQGRSKDRVASEQDTLNGMPIMFFAQPHAWETWLSEQHQASRGIWLRMAKKATGIPSITYAQALDVALCYGWIDGQKKTFDDSSWLQKFTPRGPKSMWSKVNREHPAGLHTIERAKADGRWDAAYDSQSRATVPPDFQAALDNNEPAKAFFASLNTTNRYAILWRIQTAKRAETRTKRIEEFIRMLENHEKLHP